MSASQTQFQAAHLHTQLVRKLIYKHAKEGDYRLVREMVLTPPWNKLIDILHDMAHWVVCIDTGIDKDLIQSKLSRIISFSTGEGPFGEYNYTVSSSSSIQEDIARKLQAQVRRIFPKWTTESLRDVALNCFEQSKTLDGIRLLRALNPHDYEIHSFLSYVLTAQEFKMTSDTDSEYAIRTLVSLDAYPHWFNERGSGSKQPDLLLLEVSGVEQVEIRATLIECKMGLFSNAHVNKAATQLLAGLNLLSRRWDPHSTSVDRRYWYSQLYRALVFARINLEDNSKDYEKFVGQLHNILKGEFSIQWNCKLLGFWLDMDCDALPPEVIPNEGIEIMHHPFGQLYVQRMLRSPEHRQEHVEFMNQVDDYLSETDTEEGVQFDIEDEDTVVDYEQDKDNRIPSDLLDACKHELPEVDGTSENTDTLESVQVSQKRAENSLPKIQPISNLEDVRVLIGTDSRIGESVYWEFGHPQLPNRHILISGKSGTGKTYLIQCMMLELARSGISSMVFDYTDGFTLSKLEPEFRDHLKDKIIEFPVYHQPFPINPFKRHEIDVAGKAVLQNSVDVAERIKSTFQVVYGFGGQQASAIYKATRNGLETYGDSMSLNRLRKELEKISGEIPNAKTVLSKIEPLVDREPFDSLGIQNWGEIRDNKGTIFIVQLSGFTRDVQLIITEMILWDAWYYNVKHGREDLPFPVILDEAQNLDHGIGSPSTMILTEGRKFGWSGCFATQFMKNQLKPDEIQRLQQASQRIYFNPPDAEIPDIVSTIEPDRGLRQDWAVKLSRLQKGECIVVGFGLRNGRLQKRQPKVVSVSSLAERIQ